MTSSNRALVEVAKSALCVLSAIPQDNLHPNLRKDIDMTAEGLRTTLASLVQGADDDDDGDRRGLFAESYGRSESAVTSALAAPDPDVARLVEALKLAGERLAGAADAIEARFPEPRHGQRAVQQLRAWAVEALAAVSKPAGAP